MLLGHGARLLGEHLGADIVWGPICKRPGFVLALGDDHAALRGRSERGGVAPRSDQDQLVEGRWRLLDGIAIDRLRLVAALHHTTREELDNARGAAVEMGWQVPQPDRQAAHLAAAEAPFDRGTQMPHGLAVQRIRLANQDRQQPARRKLAGARK